MTRASSIVAAAPLWRSIVEELFAQDPGVPPPGWQRTRVCTLSGLAPCAHSSKTLGEFFLPGTEPTKSAAGWYDQNGGIVLPPEYAAWCASADNVRGARVEENADELRILAPRQEAVYVVDRLLPARQQQLEFRANHRGNTTWRLNRQTLEPNAEGRIFWQLEEGDWTVEVAEGDARRVHRFHVRRQE
jgi:hypothetical protein